METVLREVRYLEIKDRKDIPQAALDLYKDNDTFLSYINNLNYTINSYNKIRETVAEVEYPLIERQLQTIDQQLNEAETTLTWATKGKFKLIFIRFIIEHIENFRHWRIHFTNTNNGV